MASRFRTIRLELAHAGAGCGYEFTAPLTEDGRLDYAAWRKEPKRCMVRRFWRGEDERRGFLVHTRSRRWTFQYELDNDPQDDESGWRPDANRFKPGVLVSITDQDGVTRRFRVAEPEASAGG
ncbi:MAG: hypothetical protein L6R19_10555 [Alphaproteobacteria bacterium]|nr:hypothetical protein [Alphaproteobacteria bacterium]